MSRTPRFTLDGQSVDAQAFRWAAIDPAASVVVDACAGSGKTTLLVTRIVRAYLEGIEPDQVLAVTFTRLASHEMHTRLRKELRRLATDDEATLRKTLIEWYGLSEAQLAGRMARARGLYEAVLNHPRGPEITTFHRWFHRLAALAPLTQGALAGATLTEESAPWLQRAWFSWLDGLARPEAAALRSDFEALVARFGLYNLRKCLESMVEQRTDWAVAAGVDLDADRTELDRAAARMASAFRDRWARQVQDDQRRFGGPDDLNARILAFAQHQAVRERLRGFAELLQRGSATQAARGLALAGLLDREGPTLETVGEWLEALSEQMIKKNGTLQDWPRSGGVLAACKPRGGLDHWTESWNEVASRVAALRPLWREQLMVDAQARAQRCGVGLMDAYRRVKQAQGLMDFADLETIAWRLLRDPAAAAYVQCRLDSRYRQLLFDEFQDTSSLQWRVIADWLQAYAGAGERPAVFVVGDPKQSIYRFRRAEARVFDAAKALLAAGFEARHAATDTTYRNSPAVVEVLNGALHGAAMPHYRLQATASEIASGFFWRLPLIRSQDSDETTDTTQAPAFDWLRTRRDQEESARYREGQAIARALRAAHAHLARHGRNLKWSEVMVLARGRTGFAAYEQALREAGLPVWSDRSGGLLDTLEGADLRALLAFVRRPEDDLALAQVLVSPLMGVDLPTLEAWVFEAGGRGLWALLRRQAQAESGAAGGVTDRVSRLHAWIERAAREPAHDFLDAVLAQSEAFAHYPAAVHPSQRPSVEANLHAMLGLALDHDAGRFPSLSRFVEHLRGYQVLDDRETPSEGRADRSDSIRLMTIHAAKGLQADVVVLADAVGRTQADGQRLQIDWPPDSDRPEAVFFDFGSKHAGPSIQDALEGERALRDRELSNLLYVALTRARYGVILSGTQPRNAPSESWYKTLDPAGPPAELPDAPPNPAPEADADFEWPLLRLSPLNVGQRVRLNASPRESGETGSADERLATELGRALHRALEWLAKGIDDHTVRAALEGFDLKPAQLDRAFALAQQVRSQPALAPAFARDAPACDEFEVMNSAGALRRLDRLVKVGDGLWIIDYKWSVDAERLPGYCAQLAEYRALVTALPQPPWDATGPVCTVLVDAVNSAIHFDLDLADTDARGHSDPR